jgi:hypothetical protein
VVFRLGKSYSHFSCGDRESKFLKRKGVLNKRKKVFVALSALFVLLGISYFSFTHELNRNADLFEPYEKKSRAAIKQLASRKTLSSDIKPLKVAWAKERITPEPGTPTLGYGNRLGEGALESDGDLFVTTFAFQAGDDKPVVMLTADLCFWPNDLSQKLASRLSDVLSREQLYFGASHTHDGPGSIVEAPLLEFMFGTYSPELAEYILDSAETAVRQALAELATGSVRVHEIPLPQFVINRTVSKKSVNDLAVVLEAQKTTGERALLVSYSAHATIIAPHPVVSSANYPGAMSQMLEEKGWQLVGFFAAETGQAGPKFEGKLAQAPGVVMARDYGKQFGKAIADAIQKATKPYFNKARIAIMRSPMALPDWQFRLGKNRILDPSLVRNVLNGQKPEAHIHGLTINDLVFVGHGFELSAEHGLLARKKAKEMGKILVPTSFNGEHHFYVVPTASFDDEGYEPTMAFFGPHLSGYIDRLTFFMLDTLDSRQGND